MRKLNCKELGHEYAIYKGEELIVMGTADECAEHMGVNRRYIMWLISPAAERRLYKRKRPELGTIGVKLN